MGSYCIHFSEICFCHLSDCCHFQILSVPGQASSWPSREVVDEARGQTQRTEVKKPSRWAVRQGRKLFAFEAPYSPCRRQVLWPALQMRSFAFCLH